MDSLEAILANTHLSEDNNYNPTTACLLETKQREEEDKYNGDEDSEDEDSEDEDEEDDGNDVQPSREATSIAPNSEEGDLYGQALLILNGTKDYEKLKVNQCKAYLRKHSLRLTGTKSVLISRIREHMEIKGGGAEVKYPKSSFSINCTGDACSGDTVLFEQRVYENFDLASRSSKGPPIGKRLVAGRIIKESYGAKKQQHTFTIEVLWSKGVCPLLPLHQLIVKGRNLYRFQTYRQPWEKEEERKQSLEEKHGRGAKARKSRHIRIGINIKNISPRREVLRGATSKNSEVFPRPFVTAADTNPPAILQKPFTTIENSLVFSGALSKSSEVFPRPCATAADANPPAILRKPLITIENSLFFLGATSKNSEAFPRPCATAADANPLAILRKPFTTTENSLVFPRLFATGETRSSTVPIMYMMKIERKDVGYIIGKGGRNIKELERLSGAQLWVRKCANQSHDMLEFRGSQEQIDAAKLLVKRYI